MDLTYYRRLAREKLTRNCAVYPVCDGDPDHLCTGQKYGAPIGLGGAGQAKTFEANYTALQRYRLKMRVIKAHHEPEMAMSIFGTQLVAPVMGAPMSGVKNNLNDAMPEEEFYSGLLKGAQVFGTIGWVGNPPTVSDDLGVTTVGNNNGWGIPSFKPQSQNRLLELFRLAERLDVIAIAVDLEGAGSTSWVTPDKRVYRKSEADLRELVDCTEKPVIFKGVMSPEEADKVIDSGASACYVSNHGGRVLDGAQGVAEVLPDIAAEIAGKVPVLADGTVRTGFDVLKMRALGADVALIGRPLAQVCVGGGDVAVRMYFEYVLDDLRRAMVLTGCDTLTDAKATILDPSPRLAEHV
ncbi:MAG TPA: alpha-hydroxy-acid oxidizing protein [Candidatus Bathyarchaeia archaeon]|nr:alpha-hydroxy-acid oxidizing protein [Candidatus Bathyarchaeia archaeon]